MKQLVLSPLSKAYNLVLGSARIEFIKDQSLDISGHFDTMCLLNEEFSINHLDVHRRLHKNP